MKKTNALSHIICLLLTLSMGVIFVISCSASATSTKENNTKPKQSIQNPRPAQIIIKFKDNVVDPSRSEFVRDISHTAKVKLSYFRPMSGGAHVFRVENSVNAGQVGKIVECLSRRSDVLYVESDNMMAHH